MTGVDAGLRPLGEPAVHSRDEGPVANGPHWPEFDQGTPGLRALGSSPDHTETFAIIRSHTTNQVKGFDPKSLEKVQYDN